jgi:hypothetical protein
MSKFGGFKAIVLSVAPDLLGFSIPKTAAACVERCE